MLPLLVDYPDEDDPNTAVYDAARIYHQRGWNVMPLVPGKKFPMAPYAHWIVERQTRRDVALMRNSYMGSCGVGAITGAVSGIVVVDTDGPEGEAIISAFEALHGRLPETLIHRSGSGRGVHRFFAHPRDGRRVKTTGNEAIKIDVKGDGGIVVLPPTEHASGGLYRVEHNAPIAPLPEGLVKFIEVKAAEARGRKIMPVLRVAGAGGADKLGDNLNRRPPLNVRNVRNLKSMLKALPAHYSEDYDSWLRVGFAIHWFDSGPVGLQLFERFSSRCPDKAAKTNFKAQWAYFGRPHDGRPITVGTLWTIAVENGWRPVPWDWREDQ